MPRREGHVEEVTGSGVGLRDRDASRARADDADAADLYRMLEETIVSLHYVAPDAWAALMRTTIALNGSFFDTQRTLQEYVVKAYQEGG